MAIMLNSFISFSTEIGKNSAHWTEPWKGIRCLCVLGFYGLKISQHQWLRISSSTVSLLSMEDVREPSLQVVTGLYIKY